RPAQRRAGVGVGNLPQRLRNTARVVSWDLAEAVRLARARRHEVRLVGEGRGHGDCRVRIRRRSAAERASGEGNGMKLLVGYDGSVCADAALRDLQLAGLPADIEAVVLAVGEMPKPPRDEAGPAAVEPSGGPCLDTASARTMADVWTVAERGR